MLTLRLVSFVQCQHIFVAEPAKPGNGTCIQNVPDVCGVPVSWDYFDKLRQSIAAGEAAAVIEPLQELRRGWAEPALATALADALMHCGRIEEALSSLEADIADGIDNHWTHYCLGHHLAGLGRLMEAAAAFRRSHALQGWTASEERGYTFTQDFFSGQIASWRRWFDVTICTTPISILEVGSWQGGSTLWLLDHVIAPRGGHITCVDTWQGSFEHAFIPELGLNVEELFDANIARSGLGVHVQKVRGTSQHILPDLQAQSYDFIYLARAHHPSALIQEVVNAHRLLKSDGFLLLGGVNLLSDQREDNTNSAIDVFHQIIHSAYEQVENDAQLLLKRKPLDAFGQSAQRLLASARTTSLGQSSLIDTSTAYLSPITGVIASRFDYVISAGPRCSTAWHLRRVFGRDQAYPFDWWVTPFQSLVRMLLEGQCFSLQLNDLVIVDTPNGQTVLNQRWFVQHHHDFSQLENGCIDPDDLNDQVLTRLNCKYQFLFQRLREHLVAAHAPLLVIGEYLSLEQWHQQLIDPPVGLRDVVTRLHPEPPLEVVVATLREFLNPNLSLLVCEEGDPACWSSNDGLINLSSHAVKSSVDCQLEDHWDWVQPLLAWDLRWQMLANHLLVEA